MLNTKYGKKLKTLSDAYKDLLNMNLWCFNKLMTIDTVNHEYMREMKKYKTLSEYQKILETCLED